MQVDLAAGPAFQSSHQLDLAAFCELDRVTHEIRDHLPEPDRVSEDVVRYLRIHVDQQFQMFLVRLQRQRPYHSLEVVAKIKIDGVQIEFARFDFGEVQNIVNHGQQ